MTNTPRLAAQCIRFYERPPRKRKTNVTDECDRGKKERAREVRAKMGRKGVKEVKEVKGQRAATAGADFITLFC